MLVAARGNRKNCPYCSIVISQQQNLPIEIDFNVLITCVSWFGWARTHDRVIVVAIELTTDFSTFVFLKRDYGIAPFSIRHFCQPRFSLPDFNLSKCARMRSFCRASFWPLLFYARASLGSENNSKQD